MSSRAHGSFAATPALPCADDRSRSTAADDTLVVQLAAGSETALARVYSEHSAEVRRFALRLVGDGAVAQDLVHEVFVRLPRAVRGFRVAGSLRAFLISMAVNQARHHVRGAARRRAHEGRHAREAPPSSADHDPVEREQLARALHCALDRLPLEQRVAFVLCEVEERSAVEAARIAGTSDGTMRARVFHARRKLKTLLSEWRDDSEQPT